ncbi:mitochondrial import receptor subunit TOM20 homolog B-like [Drosophila bipectinata]|uniref:mitochondrial import receptor subunit TOM20 homolog B-like n=1 Tax=Drosophila bipectinata TaxID=42026 RepID=UPI001C893284|nr:mitochondrial import receptor subunit TOM20 homolog B-like [Drosophila bipectinata]
MALPFIVSLTLGTGVAFFLGYCIYFDQKRLSAPDYKKRVHERRRWNRMNTATIVPCANNKAALEEYFVTQMKAGEALIKQNQVEEGLTHFINAIILCAQPAKLKSIRVLPSTEPEDYFDDEEPRKA